MSKDFDRSARGHKAATNDPIFRIEKLENEIASLRRDFKDLIAETEKIRTALQISKKDNETALKLIEERSENGAQSGNELAISQGKVATFVYNKVIEDINKRVMPKVESMVRLVNYRTEDGNDTIDEYRRALARETGSYNTNTKALTGKSSISPFVNMFFDD